MISSIIFDTFLHLAKLKTQTQPPSLLKRIYTSLNWRISAFFSYINFTSIYFPVYILTNIISGVVIVARSRVVYIMYASQSKYHIVVAHMGALQAKSMIEILSTEANSILSITNFHKIYIIISTTDICEAQNSMYIYT